MQLVIEIEAKGTKRLPDDDGKLVPQVVPVNLNWYAPFLQKTLRGRFDYGHCVEADGKALAHTLPGGVPGVRLMIDTDKRVARLVDPLRQPECAGLVKRLVRLFGFEKQAREHPENPLGLEDDREFELKDERDVPTWLFWMKRAVESGFARVVKGTVPAKIEGKPRKLFFAPEPGPNPILEQQKIANALQYAMLTPEQQQRFNEAMARQTAQAG